MATHRGTASSTRRRSVDVPHTLAVEMTLTPGAVRNVIGAAPISSFSASCARDASSSHDSDMCQMTEMYIINVVNDSECNCLGDCNDEICELFGCHLCLGMFPPMDC